MCDQITSKQQLGRGLDGYVTVITKGYGLFFLCFVLSSNVVELQFSRKEKAKTPEARDLLTIKRPV